MIKLSDILNGLNGFIPIIRTIIIVVVLIIVFNIVLGIIKRKLINKAKTRKQKSNIEIFSKTLKYFIFVLLVIIAIFSYAGSWTGLSITIGLLSAALGWALQKPITGIAAWIMLVVKRPFAIGDRIIIGNIKGDVVDITLTHIYVEELGGVIAAEENSGRIVMVPNSILFEQNITNYTSKDEYVLDQVTTAITYESNLDKALKICLDAAKKHTKEFTEETKKEPYVRTFFQASGINVHVRYFSMAQKLQEISSKITKEIYDDIMKTKDVEIAYPHTEVVFRKKTE